MNSAGCSRLFVCLTSHLYLQLCTNKLIPTSIPILLLNLYYLITIIINYRFNVTAIATDTIPGRTGRALYEWWPSRRRTLWVTSTPSSTTLPPYVSLPSAIRYLCAAPVVPVALQPRETSITRAMPQTETGLRVAQTRMTSPLVVPPW